MGTLSDLEMPPVGVIRGAGAFSGHHGRAPRSLRCAKRPESRAIVRLLNPLQDPPADTDRRLFGIDLFHFEEPLGIMIAKFIAQSEAAFRNGSDSAPFAVADLEHFRHQGLRRPISAAFDRAGILIFNLSSPGFKL